MEKSVTEREFIVKGVFLMLSSAEWNKDAA